ncbi:MAG: primosomal protein N' [Planctomycetota bacterium]
MANEVLFDELLLEPSRASDTQSAEGPFARVALERAVDKTLTYVIPPALRRTLRAGQRVRVPLGRKDRTQFGFVVDVSDTFDAEAAGVSAAKLKPVRGIEDDRVLVESAMMKLALWIGRYYCCALGLVLESMIPGAVKSKTGLGYTTVVRPILSRDELQERFEATSAKKRRTLLARLMQLDEGETIDVIKLAGDAGVTPPTVKKLAKLGVVSIETVPDLPTLSELEPSPVAPSAVTLNADQQRAYDAVAPNVRDGGFATHLLLGVTGSGKTEVYLRLMAEALAKGRQAVMLVPEIALTPQTTRRIKSRFPRVAVLHSGLSQTARHKYWQQIATGQAEVVVGARSAIFAPVPNPGLFVVDEEHESSYKQDTAPRYHARDVAIKRAQLADCPVLLGSATPSLESYHRAVAISSTQRREESKDRKEADGGSEDEKSHSALRSFASFASLRSKETIHPLHALPSRVADRPMPTIEVVDLKQAARMRKGVHLLSPRLEHLLRHTKDVGQQSILLLNRRGYASFVYNPSTDEPVCCRFCDATMTYHRTAGHGDVGASFRKALHTGQLHCHYCLAVDPLDDAAKRSGGNLSLFGLGTQRMEEEMGRKFPDLTFERVDSDTMRRSGDYERVLERFANGEIDVLLGTQMIAKGLDFPNVSLVGVVSGDTSLGLPDFRAAERTFGLITQVAGRAGRGEVPGRVVLQTFNPFDEAIRAATKQDYVGFADRELEHRRVTGLPPFGRMVRIILRDRDEEKLLTRAEVLAGQLSDAADPEGDSVHIDGPMPCPISRIAGYFRQQIVLRSPQAMPLQRVLARARGAGALSQTDRLAVDVDPVNLM